tara:strand:- start:1962 stop:2189 length:228 start_codon:yes stop_codon:yes gene_type:complete
MISKSGDFAKRGFRDGDDNFRTNTNNANILVADMGIGRKIILRPMPTTVPEAIVIEYQNFNTALGTSSYTLKFLP